MSQLSHVNNRTDKTAAFHYNKSHDTLALNLHDVFCLAAYKHHSILPAPLTPLQY